MSYKALTIAFWTNAIIGGGIGFWLIMSDSPVVKLFGGVLISFHVLMSARWIVREMG